MISLAQGTVGIKEGIAGLVLDIKHILMQLETIEGFITEIESEMERTLRKDPLQYKTLIHKGSWHSLRGGPYRRGRRLHEI